MSRTETEDGTYYYAELVYSAGGLPRLLRTRVVDGVPHDEQWQVDTGEWVRTAKLSDYRLNMEEEEIEPITPGLAEEIQQNKRAVWEQQQSGE